MTTPNPAEYLPRRAPRFETWSLRGVAHRVAFWGSPTNDPIVLLHGFLDSCETFQFLVDELPAVWSFIAFDWRGFGDSARNEGPYWFADYLGDLDAFVVRLDSQRPLRVLGHSMGGNLAALYAGVRPQCVRAVVSLEGFGLPRVESQSAPARYAQWLDELQQPPVSKRYPSLEHFTHLLQRRNPRLTLARAAFIARAWTRPTSGGGIELRGDPWHRLINPLLYRRDEAEACWAAYPGPVQMLLAEHSEFLARLGEDATARAMAAVYGQLTLNTLAGVGHMMHHEDPALVASTVRAFLEQHA